MIDARKLTDQFTAAPQIDPEDLAELKARGFSHVVNNRPDNEVPESHQAAAMADAATAAGLGYSAIAVSPSGITRDNADAMLAALSGAPGPVFAWCRSGTRSTNVWALAEACRGTDAEALIKAASNGGYDISGLKPTLEALASKG